MSISISFLETSLSIGTRQFLPASPSQPASSITGPHLHLYPQKQKATIKHSPLPNPQSTTARISTIPQASQYTHTYTYIYTYRSDSQNSVLFRLGWVGLGCWYRYTFPDLRGRDARSYGKGREGKGVRRGGRSCWYYDLKDVDMYVCCDCCRHLTSSSPLSFHLTI